MLLQQSFFLFVRKLVVELDCFDKLVVFGADVTVVVNSEFSSLLRIVHFITLVEVFASFLLHFEHLLSCLLM